jgi:hypothetical protein
MSEDDKAWNSAAWRKQYDNLPSIDAKDFMHSLRAAVGQEGMGEKVRVLTDLDQDLHEAARQAGVPDHHRLDQRTDADIQQRFHSGQPAPNHANDALTARLMGRRAIIIQIEEYETSLLDRMKEAFQSVGAKAGMLKQEVFQRTAKYLLEHAENAERPIDGQFQGILRHPSIQHERDVRNIIHIAAGNQQGPIVLHIKSQIGKNNKAYQNTLFVFCGPHAVRGADARSLAYAADADRIAAASERGKDDLNYMRQYGGSRAALMTVQPRVNGVPVVNVDGWSQHPGNRPPAAVRSMSLEENVDHFVATRAAAADLKNGGNSPMQELESRVKYVKIAGSAHDFLFNVPAKLKQD